MFRCIRHSIRLLLLIITTNNYYYWSHFSQSLLQSGLFSLGHSGIYLSSCWDPFAFSPWSDLLFFPPQDFPIIGFLSFCRRQPRTALQRAWFVSLRVSTHLYATLKYQLSLFNFIEVKILEGKLHRPYMYKRWLFTRVYEMKRQNVSASQEVS